MNSEVRAVELYEGAKQGAARVFRSGVDIHTPETIASDVVVAHFARIDEIDEPFSFGYGTGRNMALKVLRDRVMHVSLDVDAIADDSSHLGDVDVNKLRICISRLAPIAKRYIFLRYYSELSVRQIAAMTNGSVRTVQVRLKAALLELREAIVRNDS